MKTPIVFMIIVFLIKSSDGCTCLLEHPQRQMCKENSFVVLIKVRGAAYIQKNDVDNEINFFDSYEDSMLGDGTVVNRIIPSQTYTDKVLSKNQIQFATNRRYRIKIYQTFKGLDNITQEMRSYLYTGMSSCQGSLRLKTTYLIVGNVFDGRLSFSVCSNTIEWQNLPKIEKRNILANMEVLESVCDSGCQSTSCLWWDCTPKNKTEECTWNSEMEKRYGSSYNRANFLCARNFSGECDWTGADVAVMERLTRTRRHNKRGRKFSP